MESSSRFGVSMQRFDFFPNTWGTYTGSGNRIVVGNELEDAGTTDWPHSRQ